MSGTLEHRTELANLKMRLSKILFENHNHVVIKDLVRSITRDEQQTMFEGRQNPNFNLFNNVYNHDQFSTINEKSDFLWKLYQIMELPGGKSFFERLLKDM